MEAAEFTLVNGHEYSSGRRQDWGPPQPGNGPAAEAAVGCFNPRSVSSLGHGRGGGVILESSAASTLRRCEHNADKRFHC